MVRPVVRNRQLLAVLTMFALLACGATGCMHKGPVQAAAVPKELNKVNHPPYMVEPPDILEIDILQTIPLPPYRIRPLDVIGVRVPGAFPTDPIAGAFPVDPEGKIEFGDKYNGALSVSGMTLPEAKAAIEKHLGPPILKDPKAEVVLMETRAAQQIRGRHIVRADGHVSLGEYGSVYVSGMTLPVAKEEIEKHLSKYLKDPQVNLDVAAFNSKVYYVILDLGGAGQQVYRLPVTGNETVLDSISQVNGFTLVSDTNRIWVSRPGPDGCTSVLPVDWNALTEKGDPATNYQILPGDRVFVKAYPLVRVDVTMARVIAPIERLFGVTLLGTSVNRSFRTNGGNSGGF
jgi:polysaccharide export outer membrane protein